MSLHKRPYRNKRILPAFLVLAIVGGGLFLWWRSTSSQLSSNHHYDVVVVGAGPGGIAASIQAARSGMRVALLEETDWVGGQMTAAGVGTIDEGSTVERKSGIYKEFVQKATDFYNSQHKSFGTCYYNLDSLCVDPKEGQAILKQMLQNEKAHLDLYTNTHVSKVEKNGNTVTGVTAGSAHFSSKVVIDAGEYGDVIAQSGAAYRLGNGTSDAPNPGACTQSITHTAVIKYYPNGVPDNLKLKHAPPGYTPAIARHFSAFLTQNGYGLMPRPTGHYIGHRSPMSFTAYTSFRGYPDQTNPNSYNAFQQNGQTITRASLNLANDYPRDGTLKTDFITDTSVREQSDCQAKQLTLQLLYYIQHDLGQTNWSIADDEGYDTAYNRQHHCPIMKGYEAFENNMSQEPYVREARRIIGTATLTGNELQYSWQEDRTHRPTYPDSIAVGYYPMDIHDCNTADTLEPSLDNISDLPPTLKGGAFEVPMGVMIPEKIDGLLAAEKNISVSRLADGAVREQPIAMNIGQGAGELAALAVKENTSPRNVSASDLRSALKASGVAISVANK